jgi:hypothetical protein
VTSRREYPQRREKATAARDKPTDDADRRLSYPSAHPEEHEHPERYGGHEEQQDL